MIIRFTYGQSFDTEYLRLVEETAKHSSAAMIPGKWLVDSYPIRKHHLCSSVLVLINL